MASKTAHFIQNYATDPPHLISQWLEEIGFTARTIKAYNDESVPTEFATDVVALIALGGAMNAMQDVEYPCLRCPSLPDCLISNQSQTNQKRSSPNCASSCGYKQEALWG